MLLQLLQLYNCYIILYYNYYIKRNLIIIQLTQEWIIKKVQSVSSNFECNAMISEFTCKLMVSGGMLKSETVITKCHTEKKCNRCIL